MIKKPYIYYILAAMCGVTFTSCANSSHVFVYQHSTLGLNSAMNPATQKGHVRIGIRNETAIITPKLTPYASVDDPNPKPKAANSYVASQYRISDPFKAPEVSSVIATGEAARLVGESRGSAAFLSRNSTE